jgi:hypothetical protein
MFTKDGNTGLDAVFSRELDFLLNQASSLVPIEVENCPVTYHIHRFAPLFPLFVWEIIYFENPTLRNKEASREKHLFKRKKNF